MITALILGIVALALVGAPIFAVLGAFAVLGDKLLNIHQPLAQALSGSIEKILHLATSDEGKTLTTIPLFTYMGYVLAESRTAERLVAFANAVLGWIPGGLAIVTIFACAFFTTVTGASGVTIVAIGGLVMPALIKQGYKERFSLGLVTGTGSIGLLFPPSLPLIIFGIVYSVTAQAAATGGSGEIQIVHFDIARFLLAGIVPGLVLVLAVAVFAVYVAVRDNVPTTRFNFDDALRATLRAGPELFIPALMLVCMFALGLSVPESAAVTALYVLILETVFYRDIKPRALFKIAYEALQLVGAIFILIAAATALTDYFINASVPVRMTEWMLTHIHSKVVFLIALNIMLLLVGCVMDIFSALLVVVPLIAPAATGFGIDPFHLGVIFLLNLEIGYVHPPVGLNLFISAFRFRKPMTELYWAIIPYIVIMLIVLVVVTYTPGLTPIKSGMLEKHPKTPAAQVAAAGAADAGVEVKITWPDGGVWTPAHCEKPEIKNDPIAYVDCQSMFKLWTRCEAMTDALDKIECEQTVQAGGDPFEADAGP